MYICGMKLIERKPTMQMLRALRNQRITGMRRSGKSTLLEMSADEIRQTIGQEQIQFYNFEDLDTFSIGNYKQIHSHINTRLIADKMNYIFLDEVQVVENFERMVDSLFIKKNVDLYVTGSNANLLSSELATLLTGRYIEIHVLPFSFAEYDEFFANPPNFTKNESLADFIYNGSIPQAVNFRHFIPEQENDFIKAVLSTIIEKDIFKRHKSLNKQSFHKVLDFVIDSVGSIVSPRSIADTLYQVAYSVTDSQTLERELAPLQAIRDSNPKYLLSADWDTNPVFDGIRKYNVINWLLGVV